MIAKVCDFCDKAKSVVVRRTIRGEFKSRPVCAQCVDELRDLFQ